MRPGPSGPESVRDALGLARLTNEERAALARDRAELRSVYRWRPRTWGDCSKRPGPCGFVSCRFNLYLDVNDVTGAVKLNFPGKDIDDLPETCALRVAARGALSQEEVGKLTNVTEEWVRQIELAAMRKLRRRVRGVRP